MERVLTSRQKALQINLDPSVYGTFAEIGAGQETARNFFRVGGASGTIAKAMSAYDKLFSDAIYGREEDGRYVTRNRLEKMLAFEAHLLVARLPREQFPDKCFFAFSNTVTTINYKKTQKGHGWVGIRFQAAPDEAFNDIICHVRFHENEASLQQITLGTLGVNLIYGAYYYTNNPKLLLKSLYDNISPDKFEIDMIHFTGPRFECVDNRVMSLQLVKNGFTNAVIFGPDGNNILPDDLLYKKNIYAMRGSFRPVTKLNIDMFTCGYSKFINDNQLIEKEVVTLFEITLSNLIATGDVNERDFLDRADLLCKMGYTVLISNYSEYYKLTEYFSRMTKAKIALVLGVNNLIEIFNEDYYTDLSGGVFEAFGKLFTKDLRIYLYPYISKIDGSLLNSVNIDIPDRVKGLYQFFLEDGRIIDLDNCNFDYLNIYAKKVLEKISSGESGWENSLPEEVAETIKRDGMFGYKRREVSPY